MKTRLTKETFDQLKKELIEGLNPYKHLIPKKIQTINSAQFDEKDPLKGFLDGGTGLCITLDFAIQPFIGTHPSADSESCVKYLVNKRIELNVIVELMGGKAKYVHRVEKYINENFDVASITKEMKEKWGQAEKTVTPENVSPRTRTSSLSTSPKKPSTSIYFQKPPITELEKDNSENVDQFRKLLSEPVQKSLKNADRANWIKKSGFENEIEEIKQTIKRLEGEWINGSKKANEVREALNRAIDLGIRKNMTYLTLNDFLTYHQGQGNKSINQALAIKRLEFLPLTPGSSKIFKK